MYGDCSTPVFPVEDALTMIRLALAEDVRTGDVTSECDQRMDYPC